MADKIRTRFAPSPTGDLHIGGVRTAMFAWLVARSSGGEFILRIEDTDKKREQDGSLQQIIDTLDFLGIDRDEGPKAGGDYGPYLQSQRVEIYKKWADKLIDKGLAYVDKSTTEEISQWREEAKAAKQPFLFRNFSSDRYSTPTDDSWYGQYPLRFRIDNLDQVNWRDEVRGDLSAGADSLDDFVVIKADKLPTYNFAHVVDDAEMQISHIVRGEEFISSTPKFIRLYQALDLEVPKLVTVSPILGKNGGKKLSKRDGAQGALDYGREGYPVDAIWNFLCLIGWNDGTEQEIFSRQELVEKFSIDRIQKSPGHFEIDRLDWVSGRHIRQTKTADLITTIANQEQLLGVKFWPNSAYTGDQPPSDEYSQRVLGLVQEKLKKFSELKTQADIFYDTPKASKELLTKLFDSEQALKILTETKQLLTQPGNFNNTEAIEQALRGYSEDNQLHTGKYFKLVRAAVTGREVAPGLFETLDLLGQEEVMSRLDNSIAVF